MLYFVFISVRIFSPIQGYNFIYGYALKIILLQLRLTPSAQCSFTINGNIVLTIIIQLSSCYTSIPRPNIAGVRI